MNHSKKVALGAILVFGAITTGCSKPPQEQISMTAAALTSADTAEADQYVPDLFQAAQDSFAAAQAEIEIQNAKNSFTRSYDRAESLLKFAHETATEAEAFVDIRKDQLRQENETLFTQVDSAIIAVQALIKQAPRGKDGAVALAAIQEDLTAVMQSLASAREEQQGGRFAEAHDMALLAMEEAMKLQAELELVITRTTRS